MKKLNILLGGLFAIVLLGAGCRNADSPKVEEDPVFQDKNSAVSFTYPRYLKVDKVNSAPGAVTATLKKKGADGLMDNIYFSVKTRDAWLNEMVKAKVEKPNQVCENEEQFGCEKWDENVALYQKAIKDNKFDGYYAMGANKVTINNIPFVTIVTYNIDTKQYQTKYLAYVNNTRITFVDPATGGLEYGFPFQMDAKNRETVELTAQRLAKREKIDDVKTRARADELFQLVSTIEVKK